MRVDIRIPVQGCAVRSLYYSKYMAPRLQKRATPLRRSIETIPEEQEMPWFTLIVRFSGRYFNGNEEERKQRETRGRSGA